MDLGTIQGQLNDFATFGKNIGTALQAVPGLLKDLIEFIGGGAKTDVATTSSLLGSSKEAAAK